MRQRRAGRLAALSGFEGELGYVWHSTTRGNGSCFGLASREWHCTPLGGVTKMQSCVE